MSDMQEVPAPAENPENQENSAAVLSNQGEGLQGKKGEVFESSDGQSYSIGEVPQAYLFDPQGALPLNSEKMVGQENLLEKLSAEVAELIQEEVNQIQKAQKRISLWEDRIEKNKAIVQRNQAQVKKNLVEINYDKRNRDYWWNRAEQVILDFSHAEAGAREEDWSWLIKKYGLKNPDTSPVDQRGPCVEEICQGAANNLSAEYKIAGDKYEQEKRDKEAENRSLIQENGRLLTTNDQLQEQISTLYSLEIEPLQDGVLLMKELGVKLKALAQEGNEATFGDLRSWAEGCLDEFLRANPKVRQSVVIDFRRLASIPLPAKNS